MTRLLLDAMLGRLAAYLRMCGHDTAYTLDEGIEGDGEILEHARATGRTLLTRDRQLAARADAGILLESREIEGQLAELHQAGLALEPSSEPAFCGACNGPLARVDPARTTPDYAPNPATENVWRCGDCGQHFWKGSHWDDVVETLAALRAR